MVADQAYLADSGKDILMRRFIDQQQNEAARSQVVLPNAVSRLQTEHELLEASLRQQNAMIRQLILDRERDLRLETQSLPAGTQTDIDAGTQTEPHYLRPPLRKVRSDNDASDQSDDELTVIKSRIKSKIARRSNRSQIRRKIKTPILEENEADVMEKPQKVRILKATTKPRIKQTKTSEMRQKRASSRAGKRPTKSALRKEVLKEISKSLANSDNSLSENEEEHKYESDEEFSEDSIEEISPRSDKTTDSDLKAKQASKSEASKSKKRTVSVDRHAFKDKSKSRPLKRTRRTESVDRIALRRSHSREENLRQQRSESLERVRPRRSTSRLSYQYYPDRDRDRYYYEYRDRDYLSPSRYRDYYHSPSRSRRRSESRYRSDSRDRYRPHSRERDGDYRDSLRGGNYYRDRDDSRDRWKDRSRSRERDRYRDDRGKIYRSESLDRDYRMSTSSGKDLSEPSLRKQSKFHSETDLRSSRGVGKLPGKVDSRLGSHSDLSNVKKDNKTKPTTKRTSRYMEWYNKNKSKNAPKTNKPSGETNENDLVKETNAAKETIKTISGSRLMKDTESSARKKVVVKKPGAGPEHPLLQHSERRFEVPYQPTNRTDEDADSGIALTKPSMAQKKSVFTIAYNDMHTSQIKDVTTPPL